jgi:hypothetical protein
MHVHHLHTNEHENTEIAEHLSMLFVLIPEIWRIIDDKNHCQAQQLSVGFVF